MPLPAQSSSTSELNAALSTLTELVIRQPALASGLQAALGHLLESAGRDAGMLLMRLPSETALHPAAEHHLPANWDAECKEAMLEAAGQALQQGATIVATMQCDLALAIAAPFSGDEGQASGLALLIAGDPLAAETQAVLHQQLAHLARLLAWQAQSHINFPRRDELNAMQAIVATLTTAEELSHLQIEVIQGVTRLLGAQTAYLVTSEPAEKISLYRIVGGQNSQITYRTAPEKPSLVTQCIEHQLGLLIQHAQTDERFNPEIDTIDQLGVHSFLCAPLRMGDDAPGALVVLNKLTAEGPTGEFNAADLELLKISASLIAHSLSGMHVVQQLKIANADLQANRWELLRSRNTLRALFDNIPLSFYIINRNFNLLAINISRSERAGREPSALFGRQCYEALYGRNDPCPECQVSKTLFSAQPTSRSTQVWDKDGDATDWEINTYPIPDESGQVIQAILLEQDVTEKRQMEAKLIQSERLAAVGQLAAGLAHEINNPLTAVIANAQLLQRDPNLDEDAKEAVDLIVTAGGRAGQVVRNLLDLSRKEQLDYIATDINDNIQKALTLVQYEVVSRDIKVEFHQGHDLPMVLASGEHLEGVWVNLIVNAIDALSTQANRRISISTSQQGRQLIIIVADNGAGIPPERIDRIFEPFYTTKAAGHGTGLGLAVCQRIIKQHGGHIQVSSRVGSGTEFSVFLPAMRGA